MRTIGLPGRLGIGVLAMTSVCVGHSAADGGARSTTMRELAIVNARPDLPVAATSMHEAGTSAGTMCAGYMVTSGRTAAD